ncbi:SDR family NAD(P)-dependent oxidoreductase [Pararhodobacter zhoushanensis]|uniref:SDR family NAD(P)-dependent oxidoreductase n=1 Tax=Pararhodobacter zhoushanensis TaxID=2479545 RepID=UPI000F8E298F|nr:SDR family NAD(P)-dependent oxidoreductase [Pararhodobacter zhoushanensis]
MLSGKVLLITGAGQGIGRATALAAAQAGAAVVVNDIDADAAQSVVEEIGQSGGRAVAEVAAIGVNGAAEACVGRAVEAFGRLDALFSNAGVLRDSVLWKTEDDAFDLVLSTHLRGTFQCGRAAARQFKAQGGGGSLILAASPAGQLGNFGQGAYAAAKAGIVGMMRSWTLELARDRVTVNAIVPTALTRMTATIPALAPHVAAMERGEPLPEQLRARHGIGTAADIAPLVVFLASDAARGVSGQCIGIGGDRLSLWSHPAEIRTELQTQGWTPEALAAQWESFSNGAVQRVGVPLDFD